jgi:hypothetical protein
MRPWTGTLPAMGWGFVWLMLVLKIPIAMLLYIVWWAIKQSDMEEEVPETGDGGTRKPVHPRGPLPHAPRRGPHAEPQAPAPARIRSVVAKSPEHQP